MAMKQPQIQIKAFTGEISYATENGAQITLSPQIIRQYLVNGNAAVSDQEVMMFMQLCKYQGLNPFLREAYLIKYSDKNPATIVTGKEVFTKRAERHPEYRGQEAGIYVLDAKGEVKERKGTMALPNETIVGGWAKIYREGYTTPIEYTVSFEEYAQYKDTYVNGQKTGEKELNTQWKTKPGTMIRKCALVAALREAFPAEFGGMYSQEEINTLDASTLSDTPITPPQGVIIDNDTGEITQPPYSDNDAPPFEDIPQYENDLPFPEAEQPVKMGGNNEQCSECGTAVTAKVAKYSVDKLGRCLCFNCQKTAN